MVTTSDNGLTRLFILVLFTGGLLAWLLFGKPLPNMEFQEQPNIIITPAPPEGGIGGGSESLQQPVELSAIVNQYAEQNAKMGIEVQEIQEDIYNLEMEIQSIHDQLTQISGSMVTLNHLVALEDKIVKLSSEIAGISKRVSDVETAKIPSLQESLVTLSQQVERLETEVDHAQNLIQYSTLTIIVLALLNVMLVIYLFLRQRKFSTALKVLVDRYGHSTHKLNRLRKNMDENGSSITALRNFNIKRSKEMEGVINALKIMDKRLQKIERANGFHPLTSGIESDKPSLEKNNQIETWAE
jgi:chromosome segregation ATPase